MRGAVKLSRLTVTKMTVTRWSHGGPTLGAACGIQCASSPGMVLHNEVPLVLHRVQL